MLRLVFAIVQSEDADPLSRRLNSIGVRQTQLHTIGGFLARGNVTLIMAVDQAQLEPIFDVIRNTCRTRKHYINATPIGSEPAHLVVATAAPLEVLVGGATVFVLPIQRFLHLPEQQATAASRPPLTDSPAPRGDTAMQLVFSILHSDDADATTRALIAGGYRVTRMNSAGGFFRRGNVTLLIGVEAAHVDDVLGIIRGHCRTGGAAPAGQGNQPRYGATVFVLDTAHTEHM